MRTKTVIDGFKNSQKIRIVIGGIALYTTVYDIAFNLFGTTQHRTAVWLALEKLAYMRRVETANGGIAPIGLACDSNGMSVQVDLA